ncbi:hypothetical protein [Bifidobacterium vansinderenii]|uniref:hypothetical protein n=1 Tax=Bifidobacterium vansinderenii TaxID=1984871 RepID=UPI001177A46C|nr:hypothetical protein [Bifidobacterium vansinderenii]
MSDWSVRDGSVVSVSVDGGPGPDGSPRVVDVLVNRVTGDLRFVLSDGFVYEHDSSDLGFGETDPVRRARALEAIAVVTSVRLDHPDLFVDSDKTRYAGYRSGGAAAGVDAVRGAGDVDAGGAVRGDAAGSAGSSDGVLDDGSLLVVTRVPVAD